MIVHVAFGWMMLATSPHAHAAPLDTAQIEQLTGAKGRLDRTANAFKVTVPRTDLNVTVGGVKLSSASGLASWAAFENAGAEAMVMGDMLLTEDQVNPVLSVALDNGLAVTALHGHFLGETPRLLYMHVAGSGRVDTLAAAIGRVFARVREPGVPLPTADIDPSQSRLDLGKLMTILGHRGDLSGGVYKVVVGRTAHVHGHAMGATMGVNTWAAFWGADDRAAVDGDVVMKENELQPVLKALRRAGLQIVAIHQHMTGEEPRLVFLHYWGVGRAEDLARGVRAALDLTRSS